MAEADSAASRQAAMEDTSSFCPSKYLLQHRRALLQRARSGPGRSPAMRQLYLFWKNFLPSCYKDVPMMLQSFQRLAEEDAAEGQTFGLSALFSFCKSALLEAWDAELYKQFEEMALRYADYLDYQDGVEKLCSMLESHGTSSSDAAGTAPNAGRSEGAPSSAHIPDMAATLEAAGAEAPGPQDHRKQGYLWAGDEGGGSSSYCSSLTSGSPSMHEHWLDRSAPRHHQESGLLHADAAATSTEDTDQQAGLGVSHEESLTHAGTTGHHAESGPTFDGKAAVAPPTPALSRSSSMSGGFGTSSGGRVSGMLLHWVSDSADTESTTIRLDPRLVDILISRREARARAALLGPPPPPLTPLAPAPGAPDASGHLKHHRGRGLERHSYASSSSSSMGLEGEVSDSGDPRGNNPSPAWASTTNSEGRPESSRRQRFRTEGPSVRGHSDTGEGEAAHLFAQEQGSDRYSNLNTPERLMRHKSDAAQGRRRYEGGRKGSLHGGSGTAAPGVTGQGQGPAQRPGSVSNDNPATRQVLQQLAEQLAAHQYQPPPTNPQHQHIQNGPGGSNKPASARSMARKASKALQQHRRSGSAGPCMAVGASALLTPPSPGITTPVLGTSPAGGLLHGSSPGLAAGGIRGGRSGGRRGDLHSGKHLSSNRSYSGIEQASRSGGSGAAGSSGRSLSAAAPPYIPPWEALPEPSSSLEGASLPARLGELFGD